MMVAAHPSLGTLSGQLGVGRTDPVVLALALILGGALLLYVGYCAVKARRRTVAYWFFVVVGNSAGLTIALSMVGGWDDRSVLRLTGMWVVVVGLLRFLWKSDDEMR